MKLKSLFLLMFAVAIGAAAYFYSFNQNVSLNNSFLVPNLTQNLNSINKFTVHEAQKKLLSSISRSEKGWVVDNRAAYPANLKAVRQVFTALAEAKLVEAKTSNSDNYTKLGVEDVDQQDAQGVLVSIDGLTSPVNIIFGNDGSSGKNTQYIRNQGEAQSWLINKKINFSRDTTDWLEKDLIDIPPERIKTIQIKHPDGTEININNTGNAAYEFDLDATASEGKKISDSEIYQVANALSSLQLRDVISYEILNKVEIEPIVSIFKTFDGLTITTTSYASNIEPYFTLEIQFNANDVDKSVNVASEENKSSSDAALVSDPKAAEELANSAKSKLTGWAYLFPTITKNALTKKLDDFFIDKDA